MQDEREGPLARLVREKQGPEHAERTERLAKLAEAHRVWAAAFNKAGGALANISRELPHEFLVEHLARARLHDAIALVCDGKDCNLLAYSRQGLALVVGEEAADLAAQAMLAMFAADRASQQKMRESGGTRIVEPRPPDNDNG